MLMLLTIGLADGNGQSNLPTSIVDSVTVIDSLKIGDPAPAIAACKWIKGNPVTKFVRDKVYVVEFWATWCGPCQAAMPHLSELARTYKGKVEVISFDVKEDKKTDFLLKVERFVKWSGDRMDYAVAIDLPDDIMEKTWLQAAGANGIPHVFIIDQQGKIAWHGHPDYVGDVLSAMVNGRYDEAGKKLVEEQIKAKSQLYDSLAHKMMAAKKDGDYQTALAIVEEISPIFPALRSDCANMKYEFLSHIDSKKARQFADTLLAKWHPKDQVSFAAFILSSQPNGAFKPDYEFALKWVKYAAAYWDPQDEVIFVTLAKAYYKTGNKEQAISNQQKFIEMLKKDPAIKPQTLEMAEKTLQLYLSMKH